MDGRQREAERLACRVVREGAIMLPEPSAPTWSKIDLEVFEHLVPPDHYLRRAPESIQFEGFRPILAGYYSPDQGRPAEDPVRMLKLEFLQYHDNLSDRQVVQRAETDVAYRYFLGLALEDELPDPSLLCIFRGRLGVEGHRAIFDKVVAQAREHGLVKDRLRLKDATHVIADVAIPTTLALLAQTRDKLLLAAEPFDPLRVEGERARAEMIHTATQSRSNEERLRPGPSQGRRSNPQYGGPRCAAWEARRLVRRLSAGRDD
jgi:transposase